MRVARQLCARTGRIVGFIFVVWTVSCSTAPAPAPPAPGNTSAVAPSAPAAAVSAAPTPEEQAAADASDRQAQEEADAAANSLPKVGNVKWTGDLDGMLERRVIRVLTTYSKVNYFIDAGRPRGLVYDAFRQFEDDLNARLKTKNVRIHVVFVPVAHDDLIPALLDGRGDVISAGVVLTSWRKEQVDFTNPTRRNISSIVVTGPDAPPVATPLDLGGREVYLRKSEVSAAGVAEFQAMLAKAGREPVRMRPAPEVLADEDILEMVNAGLVPATIANDYVAEFWQQVFPRLVLNRGAAVRSNAETGMLVRKNSPQLLAELNGYLARFPEGSARRNMLFREYLKSVKWAKSATASAEREKFDKSVALFRKYGGQYNVDYLLMAAQGYQESQLNQEAKSSVGAIGIMQVMPATGKDLKVGDIAQLEPNIHAGVKYMRFMMDRYYKDAPMARLDKGLFTFASYNAGPARVQDMRARAAKRGLNPNVWFNNVEVVAAEQIGRETVQYVANIYKYFLAYSLLYEQQEERNKAKRVKVEP